MTNCICSSKIMFVLSKLNFSCVLIEKKPRKICINLTSKTSFYDYVFLLNRDFESIYHLLIPRYFLSYNSFL